MNKVKTFAAMVVTAGMFAYAVPASAQTIGFKVGPTWSNVDFEGDDDNADRLQSIGGGGFVRFGMMGLALQAEVLAVTKGTKETEEGFGELKTKLDYIEVPLLARFSMGSSMPFSPYIMVGPSFGFNYGCTLDFESDDEDVIASDEVDCDDEDSGLGVDIKSLDIGATGVLGFEFKAGPGAILVEGRYTHGFTDILDTDAEDSGAKNRMFGVMAGYSFTLR